MLDRLKQPVFLPFYGLFPIIYGAIQLSHSTRGINACDASTQGEFCGLHDFLAAVFFISLGILYSVVVGLIVAIKYRKKIIWANWAILWIIFIVIGAAAIFIGKYYDDQYDRTHNYLGQPY